ncbi:methyltransferase family protein [Microbulbifer yueqingensis]|uniref:Protein-S-isoprenylcysteine O-methyltransferase Ste14 n=1 Tax=Microbulbifer yueqingensis TaxID=658219 RepID=A0A1G9EGG6_9GAMM|nr:isoprenylcysteine carboxylmethyltransferase family protein [Microbulbifer yueqingensis]SDK75216.1 Protein-S-isoprenylcysteine O-methyltransferase Ste14 [Microbulbifer yueqingensis]
MSRHSEDATDHPDIIALPPIIVLVFLAAALLLQWLWPLSLTEEHRYLWRPCLVLAGMGLALALWGKRALDRAGTNVDPRKPTTGIVSDGPYRFSRNPLYLAQALVYLGITLLFNSWWGPALLAPLMATLHFGVIRPEERYLLEKFGGEYRSYRKRVRRYL